MVPIFFSLLVLLNRKLHCYKAYSFDKTRDTWHSMIIKKIELELETNAFSRIHDHNDNIFYISLFLKNQTHFH